MFDWVNHHRHPAPLHRRVSLHLHRFTEFLNDGVKCLDGPLSVGPLAPAEQHGKLHLVPVCQKLSGPIHFDEAVVGVRFGAKPDFLQNDDVAARRVLLPLLSLVLEFAVIHDAADRRSFHGRHLNQVESRLSRQTQGFVGGKDAPLPLILINHAYRCYADLLIETQRLGDDLLPFKKRERRRAGSEANATDVGWPLLTASNSLFAILESPLTVRSYAAAPFGVYLFATSLYEPLQCHVS